MIRVLHVFNIMGNGGIEHFVMDRYRMIDRTKVQFDFLITSPNPGYFDKEINELGGKVYHTHSLTKKPLRTFLDIKNIVKANGYSIIHRHTGNAIGYFDLRAARCGGAKHLIIHSHNTNAEKKIIHRLAKTFLSFNCVRFACSEAAGRWLFGNKDFQVIPNAIDVEKYCFSSEDREKIREKYGLNDSFVVGHVGRIDYQKNHSFLIDIFYELQKRIPDSKLVCVGDGNGHLKKDITEKVNSLGLTEKVVFTGSINNVNEVMNAFDVFCLPSKYEGLSITLIEAQTNGLHCITSKDRVTTETDITGLLEFFSLEKDADEWAAAIIETDRSRDLSSAQRVIEAGYNLPDSVEFLQSFYEGLE
ncbi:MAG: glycosyltransferase family 1 protein [Eubacteriales bacterium]